MQPISVRMSLCHNYPLSYPICYLLHHSQAEGTQSRNYDDSLQFGSRAYPHRVYRNPGVLRRTLPSLRTRRFSRAKWNMRPLATMRITN